MRVPEPLRQRLQAKFPDCDFTSYFTFVESLSEEAGERHHILPRHEFPDLEKCGDNIIKISYPNHFKAHYWLATCAPDCNSFQMTVYFMANYKARRKVTTENLSKVGEIYARGKEHQRKIATERWDDRLRSKLSERTKRFNEEENRKLRNFKCDKCGAEFQQITKCVYAGHRRFCLNYGYTPVPERPFVVPTNEITKRCGKCGVEKLLDEFNVERKSRLGRANRCRECCKAERKNKPTQAETTTLRDYTCPNCGTEFKQVKPGVFGGHRRGCLNYGARHGEFLTWEGTLSEFANKHNLPLGTVCRWKSEYESLGLEQGKAP